VKVLAIALSIVGVTGCKSLPVVNKYQYVEAEIDDLPKFERIEGIFIMNHYHPEMAEIMMLIGNQNNVEKIVGREINPEKVIDDTSWVKKIYQHYSAARRMYNFGKGSFNDTRVAFITRERAYMIEFGVDDKDGKYTVVYGDYYESKELRKDFEELGILEREEPSDTKKFLEYLKK